MKRCKNCLLPASYPDIKFNDDGICNFCLEQDVIHKKIGSDKKSVVDNRLKFKNDFEKYVKEIKGKEKYDCLLLLSGGKDSIYLLYLLKEKYGLNVLTLTVDTGLLNKKAIDNIKKTVNHFKVDHVFFKPENNFYKRLYRHFLTKSNEKTYCDTICEICQKVVLSTGLNKAAKDNIPFIALAYSPDQASFYEYPKEKITSSWIPKELYNKPFNKKDRNYFWNPENFTDKKLPRIIVPFYAIEYPGIRQIMNRLSELGLGMSRNFNPLNTSCYLVWLMMHLDLRKYGYNPYIEETSALIRINKTKHSKWFLILIIGSWLLKHGLIRRTAIERALKHLDLRHKDVYN